METCVKFQLFTKKDGAKFVGTTDLREVEGMFGVKPLVEVAVEVDQKVANVSALLNMSAVPPETKEKIKSVVESCQSTKQRHPSQVVDVSSKVITRVITTRVEKVDTRGTIIKLLEGGTTMEEIVLVTGLCLRSVKNHLYDIKRTRVIHSKTVLSFEP